MDQIKVEHTLRLLVRLIHIHRLGSIEYIVLQVEEILQTSGASLLPSTNTEKTESKETKQDGTNTRKRQ